jgi:hypothetical protein
MDTGVGDSPVHSLTHGALRTMVRLCYFIWGATGCHWAERSRDGPNLTFAKTPVVSVCRAQMNRDLHDHRHCHP